jgi:hypothetical protein
VRLTVDAASNPWMVPVPVRRSRFVAMDPSHDVHNLETDLATTGPFGLDPVHAPGELLYADLQTLPLWNPERRLGSGRAGVYRGAYLKGMGRTQLAANWADPDDRYHNTGHMLPSAAVREYLASRAMAALGLAHHICPCEGLLLAPLEHSSDALLAAMLPDAVGRFATADRRLQAITVKPADFARLSNFAWALAHVGAPSAMGALFYRMHYFLQPPGQRPRDGSGSSPAAIVQALARAIERGIAGFAAYQRAGVFWGSLSNNLTADGRFLDLEVPMLLLRPFLGMVAEERAAWTGHDWFGLEVFTHVQEARAFVTALRERIRFLSRFVFVRGVTHDFTAELARELDEQLRPEHILWSRARLVDAATAVIVDSLGLDGVRAARVRGIAERQYTVCFEDTPVDWSDVRLRRLPVQLAPPEPGRERSLAYPDFLADVITVDLERARAFNDGLRQVDASADIDELFARVRALEASL